MYKNLKQSESYNFLINTLHLDDFGFIARNQSESRQSLSAVLLNLRYR